MSLSVAAYLHILTPNPVQLMCLSSRVWSRLSPSPSVFPDCMSGLPKYAMPSSRTPQVSISLLSVQSSQFDLLGCAPSLLCRLKPALPSRNTCLQQSLILPSQTGLQAPPDICSSCSNLWDCYSSEKLNPKHPF